MDVDVEPWGDALKAIDLAADLVYEVQLRAIMVPPVPGGDVLVAGHRHISEHAVDEVAAGHVAPEECRVSDLHPVVEVLEAEGLIGLEPAPPRSDVPNPERLVGHDHLAVYAHGARAVLLGLLHRDGHLAAGTDAGLHRRRP